MRGFQEIRGQCTRIIYDRERANIFIKTEPHRFAERKPDSEVDAEHINGNGTKPLRQH